MMGEKVIKMLSQLVMMILMARILGPEELGSLMYCFAIASPFIFLIL
jgi:O-antigen/teichoic acid export membrane protein